MGTGRLHIDARFLERQIGLCGKLRTEAAHQAADPTCSTPGRSSTVAAEGCRDAGRHHGGPAPSLHAWSQCRAERASILCDFLYNDRRHRNGSHHLRWRRQRQNIEEREGLLTEELLIPVPHDPTVRAPICFDPNCAEARNGGQRSGTLSARGVWHGPHARRQPRGFPVDIATIFRRRKMPGVRCLAYRPIGRNRSSRTPCR
jgi:hypothetical protein